MAETKKGKTPEGRKIVSATTGEDITQSEKKAKGAVTPEDQKKAKTLRIVAVLLWVLGFAAEALAYFLIIDYFHLADSFIFALVALGVDLVLVIIGSQLWKKANHMDPASKANKVKFWMWNNLGLFASMVAFLPFIILVLTNKEMDGKNKQVAAIVAIAALLVAGVTGYDWNPMSQEDMEAAQMTANSLDENGEVYWTRFGKKYHFYEDCSSLNRSQELTKGSIDQAVEAGRDSLCKICERRAESEGHLHTSDELLNTPESMQDEAA